MTISEGKMEIKEFKPFECENGLVYSMPAKHCAFCKHCTDIFYDYSNGPYMFICELDCDGFESCGNFSYNGYVFDEEDYIKRVKEKTEALKKVEKQLQKKDIESFYNFLMGLGG